MTSEDIYLDVPELHIQLHPGNQVRLQRFDDQIWIVGYGWFSWGGNRPWCGWYLTDAHNPGITKPLQQTDLYDIYVIQQ